LKHDTPSTEWLTARIIICQAGGQQAKCAWNELAEALWPHIVRIAAIQQRRSGFSRQQSSTYAEDAAVEAFITLYTNIHKITEPGGIIGWFFTAIRNYYSNRWRRAQREIATDDAWVFDTAPHHDQTSVLSVVAHLRVELRRLKPDEREVVYLRFWEEMNATAIAKHLGVSRHTVNYRLERIYAKLRHTLLQVGYSSDEWADTNT
jgi:RNA polymerase sigma factor (sigma-70 family)